MARRMNIALLSQEVEGVVDPVSEDTVAEVIDTMEVADDAGETSEVAEGGEEIAAIGDVIDEADSDAETIEEIADTAERSEEEGGLQTAAVESLNVAINAILTKHGVRPMTQVATENFASKAKRPQSTKIAIEGWKEKAKELWDNIVKVVMGWIEKAKLFFKALFNRAERLRQQGESLVKVAKGKGAVKPETKEIDIGSSAKYLVKGGSVATGAELIDAFGSHVKQIDAQVGAVLNDGKKSVGAAQDLSSSINKTDMFDAELAKFPFPKGSKAAKSVGLPEGFEKTEMAEFIGAHALYSIAPKSDATAGQVKDGMKAMKVLVEPVEGSKMPQKTTGAAASTDDIAMIGEIMSKHYGAYAGLTKKLDAFSEEVKSWVKKTPKVDGDSAQDNMKVVVKLVQVLGGLATQTQSQIYGYDVNVGSAVYSYCVKSLKAYNAKEKVKEAAPAAA